MDTGRFKRMVRRAVLLLLAMMIAGVVPAAMAEKPAGVTGDTMLYFNPEGGKYFHKTHECHMVHPSCHSVLEGFLASQLDEEARYLRLIPCPDCFPAVEAEAQAVLPCCQGMMAEAEDGPCGCCCFGQDGAGLECLVDGCEACIGDAAVGCCACMGGVENPEHVADGCEACAAEALAENAYGDAQAPVLTEALEHTEADCLACAAEEALAGENAYVDAPVYGEEWEHTEADCLACGAEEALAGEYGYAMQESEAVSWQTETSPVAYGYSAYPNNGAVITSGSSAPAAYSYSAYPSNTVGITGGSAPTATYYYAPSPNTPPVMVVGQTGPMAYYQNPYTNNPALWQGGAPVVYWAQPAAPAAYAFDAYQNGMATLWAQQPVAPVVSPGYASDAVMGYQATWSQTVPSSSEPVWFGEAEYQEALAFLNVLWAEGYPASAYSVLGWKITPDKSMISITALDNGGRVFETDLARQGDGWEILNMMDIGNADGE